MNSWKQSIKPDSWRATIKPLEIVKDPVVVKKPEPEIIKKIEFESFENFIREKLLSDKFKGHDGKDAKDGEKGDKGDKGDKGNSIKGDRGDDGKSFKFSEHKKQINAIIRKHIESIKDELKLKFDDLSDEEKLQLKGKDGRSFTNYLGGGGGVAQSTVETLIANAIANVSSGGSYVSGTTSIDLTITNQTFLAVTGAIARTISLKNPAIETKSVTITNDSSENVTVNVATGQNILNDISLIIVPGNCFTFCPQGNKYYVS